MGGAKLRDVDTSALFRKGLDVMAVKLGGWAFTWFVDWRVLLHCCLRESGRQLPMMKLISLDPKESSITKKPSTQDL
jgi:hypothetical protein